MSLTEDTSEKKTPTKGEAQDEEDVIWTSVLGGRLLFMAAVTVHANPLDNILIVKGVVHASKKP